MKKIIICVVSFFFSIVCYAENSHPTAFFKNSCGIIQSNFTGGSPHSCNGFLVRKDKQIFFITVAHLIQHGSKAESVTIILPELGKQVTKGYDKRDFLEGDLAQSGKSPDETTDVLAINLTKELSSWDSSNLISFEMLTSKERSSKIVISDGGSATLLGYPANIEGQIMSTFEARNFPIYIRPNQFGELVRLPNGEKPAGLYISTQINEGDCGRPILAKIGLEFKVLGLIKSSVGPYGFVNDSTAIARTIESVSI